MDDLTTRVRAWIADDPDPHTAQEACALLIQAETHNPSLRERAIEQLSDRFNDSLQFGTAGLRGALGAGPNRMNRAVVMRTTAGLVSYAQDIVSSPRVVVGYDARHMSHRFALDAASVAAARGCDVHLFTEPVPTPLLAFAMRSMNADVGIMVTASHNPVSDNGYKVYLGGRIVTDTGQGAQIVSPMDEEITSAISSITSVASIPRVDHGWSLIGDTIRVEYSAIAAQLVPPMPARVRIVHTGLHGVGGYLCPDILTRAGFDDVHPVASQQAPDPDFPTAPSPNPELPGVLDEAIALATTIDADLIVANDPDADRCAVAVPDGSSWRQLSGDEMGCLIIDTLARIHAGESDYVIASSLVSSRLAQRIAEVHGIRHVSTLTGFKWIARVEGLVFGYEEAIGYCVDPAHVRDKDGMSAAVVFAHTAQALKTKDTTFPLALDELSRTYGMYLTDQLTHIVTSADEIDSLMSAFRNLPPTALASSPVVKSVDYLHGTDLPPTDAIALYTEDDVRVIVRPSGTEPLLKCYIEVIHSVGDDIEETKNLAKQHIAHVRADISSYLSVHASKD